MKLIKLIMPSQGDMEIVKQEGGTILLKPTYFGGECAGPVIQFVETSGGPDKVDFVGDGGRDNKTGEAVEASYRIKFKKDNELRLAKAD
jgi:hypothetical protein